MSECECCGDSASGEFGGIPTCTSCGITLQKKMKVTVKAVRKENDYDINGEETHIRYKPERGH